MLHYFKKQSGTIMPVTALALLSIMGMSSLVFDSSHLYVNKTKLQNLVDSAALASAKSLDDSGTQFLARRAANNIINSNLAQPNYSELADLGLNQLSFTTQFSDTRNPFVANPAATRFVRISLNQDAIQLNTIFLSIFGRQNIPLAVSAVAGPSPDLGSICNAVPTVVCGDPNIAPDHNGMYGYTFGDQVTLALGNTKNNAVGPGNYQLLDLGGDSNVRSSLAGGSTTCVAAQGTVETKPGVNRGPVTQGFNTRFGIYNGPVSSDEHPPDVITNAGGGGYPDTYLEYRMDKFMMNYDEPDGIANRRVVPVPFGNCNGTVNGRGNVEIMGFGCIFLSQPAENNGKLKTVQMFGELVRDCRTSGTPGSDPNGNSGVHTIQLYGDPDRWES